MADLFLQITATPENSGSPKALLVWIPRARIEQYQAEWPGKLASDELIAKQLAHPLAHNLFTHRASFGRFRLAHSFSFNSPADIKGLSPEFEHDGLKAWIL